MRKNKLKLVTFLLAFLLIPVMPYARKQISQGIGDVLGVVIVMVILTALETNALGEFIGEDYSGLIPQSIKTAIGVVMLLGLASLIKQLGWLPVTYFNDPIVLQLPITLVDVCILVIVGTTLYWAGGVTYQAVITVTTSVGNACYYILEKMNLVELDECEESSAQEVAK